MIPASVAANCAFFLITMLNAPAIKAVPTR